MFVSVFLGRSLLASVTMVRFYNIPTDEGDIAKKCFLNSVVCDIGSIFWI